MPTPGIAANAYAQLARLSDPTNGGLSKTVGDPSGGSSGPSFGEVLKNTLTSIEETGHKSDAQSQAMVAGKASLVDVATAVSETETAIQALVTVRDRVITAYQQILQMPI